MVKKMLLVLVLAIVFSCIVGCHTVQGIGQDIEWIGQKGAEIVH